MMSGAKAIKHQKDHFLESVRWNISTNYRDSGAEVVSIITCTVI
jgi:hypothetical protein